MLCYQATSYCIRCWHFTCKSYHSPYDIFCYACSIVADTVHVTTPLVNKTQRRLPIELVLNNRSRINTGRVFEYRSDPVFTDIRPRDHIYKWVAYLLNCNTIGAVIVINDVLVRWTVAMAFRSLDVKIVDSHKTW